MTLRNLMIVQYCTRSPALAFVGRNVIRRGLNGLAIKSSEEDAEESCSAPPIVAISPDDFRKENQIHLKNAGKDAFPPMLTFDQTPFPQKNYSTL